MSCHVFDAGYLLEQYELLRQEAIEVLPLAQQGHGLLLFLTRGMVAWMEAVSCLAGRQAVPTQFSDSPGSVTLRPEVTTVLANMVLGCMQEARA
jgi:hypothetical protein